MWDAIDDRTIPELSALAKAWAKYPPLPAVVAALIGAKQDDPEPSAPSPGPTPAEKAWLRQQMFAMQQAGGGVSKQVLAALEA